jgi:hypothetical protein
MMVKNGSGTIDHKQLIIVAIDHTQLIGARAKKSHLIRSNHLLINFVVNLTL